MINEIDITQHIGLVKKIASTKTRNKQLKEELELVGMLALAQAKERFDVSKGNQFSTFAWISVNGQILQYLREHVNKHDNCFSISDREEELAHNTDNLEDKMIKEQQKDKVYKFLNSYNNKNNVRAFLAVYLESEKINELANNSKVSPWTIRARAATVKKDLILAMK